MIWCFENLITTGGICIVSEGIELFLKYLRETAELNRIGEANENEENNVTQDLLHSIEIEPHTYNEYAKLSKMLKVSRQNRRNAMNLKEQTAPVKEWSEQNLPIIRSLEQLLNTVRKLERKSENRVYTPRTKILEEDNVKSAGI